MNSEFELIDLFNQIGSKYYKENGVIVAPGDDCAVFESKKENIKKLSDAADITKLLNLLKSVNYIKLISNKPINKDISFDNLMVEYRNVFK